MNILILTGRFGMGHYSVAQTMVQDIQKENPNTQIVVKDIFEYAMPDYCDVIYDFYTLLVNKGSHLYNFYYKHTENSNKSSKLPFITYFLHELHQLVATTKPDVIISTLPFCCQLVSTYKAKYNCPIPMVTCITDVSVHREWLSSHTDLYLVASSVTKKELIAKGVPDKQILVTGIPVKEQFRQLSHEKQQQTMKRLLIMGGGLGMLPKEKNFYLQLNALPDVKTTVIVGNNAALYKKLAGKYENIEVIGYTDQVYRYMQEADLLISKPGGITLFETIYAELPILVFPPFLQQEYKNACFIQELQIGKVLWQKPQNMAQAISELLHDDLTLYAIRNNMQQIKCSLKSRTLYQILTGLQRRKGACA